MNDWRDKAACLDVDLDVFYVPGSNTRDPYPEARKLCATCPVVDACLEAALEAESSAPHVNAHGYRGGKTASARRRILAERPPVCNDCGGPANKRNLRDRNLCDPCRQARVAASHRRFDASRPGGHRHKQEKTA